MKTLTPNMRIDLKNILFATDFSPAAAAALPYATELARRYESKLYALHVRMTASAEALPVFEAATTEEERVGTDALRNTTFGIQPIVLIEEGDLWPVMKGVIEKNKIDLIVAGTRGRTGVGKLLLGSAAEQILRNAPCAVLTVGPHSQSRPNPGGFTKILYATDFTAESAAAAPFAISLAQEYGANLTLLHVIENTKAGDLIQARELIPSAERQLRQLVSPESETWCKLHYAVEQGTPAEKILEVAQGRKADLIVLGVKHLAGLAGAATHFPITMAHKIVSHAECPVLTVRTDAA